MKNDNLNRVRGILSARQGAVVPKFDVGGGAHPGHIEVTSVKFVNGKWILNNDPLLVVSEATAQGLSAGLLNQQGADLVGGTGQPHPVTCSVSNLIPQTGESVAGTPATTQKTTHTPGGVYDAATDIEETFNISHSSPAATGGTDVTPTNNTPTKPVDPRIQRGRDKLAARQVDLSLRPPEGLGAVPYEPSTYIPGSVNITPTTAVENAAAVVQSTMDKVTDATATANAAAITPQPTQPTQPTSPNQTTTVVTPNDSPEPSAGVNTEQTPKKTWAERTKAKQIAKHGQANYEAAIATQNKMAGWGEGLSAGIQAIGSAFGAQQEVTDSELTKGITAGWDAAAATASQFGPIGQAVGSIMSTAKATGDIIQGITGGTDQISKTDQWMASPLLSWNVGIINDIWGEKSNAFQVDQNILAQVGSSYGGTASDITKAASEADKKFGLFSKKARLKANAASAAAASKQNTMGDIADTARDQRSMVQSMGEQAGLAYSMITSGGYEQKYTYAAKHGGLLEWNPVIELEWQPQVELNWELPTLKEGGSIDFVEELEWIPEFKSGGKTEESDVPETEETNQKNVIPEGALHKNKHHMEHAEGLTKKGIPVVDEDGEQQAEIEHSEIIFTLEVTKKLEEYYEIFYSEDATNKEKEQAALDAGKLLVYQILENTEDRTGLIESCKKGGSLTLKKSTEDLIEEVLEWMPTVVIVETEEEPKKEPKKEESNVSKKDTKDEIKEMIKEVLIELLVK